MIVFPAIDLRGGKCVRLSQGRADRETVYSADPAEVASGFAAAGSEWVHVVDLDGAFGGDARNAPAVRGIIATGLKVQLGGGLRTRDAVTRVLDLGVSRAVVGTRAAESEAFVADLVRDFGKSVAVGIDARNGRVAVKGWVDTTETDSLEMAGRMDALGVSTIIHTDIATDGMLTGPNVAAQQELLGTVKARVIASGGIGNTEDVRRLAEMAKTHSNLLGVIVGKALYEKRVDLRELLALTRG